MRDIHHSKKRVIADALKIGVVWWLIAGIIIWTFLAWPYGASALECRQPGEQGLSECLKPVAKKLRSDSNIATYATATVAAAITLQLANRNRESRLMDDENPRP